MHEVRFEHVFSAFTLRKQSRLFRSSDAHILSPLDPIRISVSVAESRALRYPYGIMKGPIVELLSSVWPRFLVLAQMCFALLLLVIRRALRLRKTRVRSVLLIMPT